METDGCCPDYFGRTSALMPQMHLEFQEESGCVFEINTIGIRAHPIGLHRRDDTLMHFTAKSKRYRLRWHKTRRQGTVISSNG